LWFLKTAGVGDEFLGKYWIFFGNSVVLFSSSGVSVGKRLGKVAGVPLFTDVVRLSVVGGPLVKTATMVWCEAEKISSLDREQEPLRQAVDCFALEMSSFGPLGFDLVVDSYGLESSSCPLGKDLLACSTRRVDDVDGEIAGDVTVKESGVFWRLLNLFEGWLCWACAHKSQLGQIPSVGLKRRMGRAMCCLGLGRKCFSVGSNRVCCRLFFLNPKIPLSQVLEVWVSLRRPKRVG
jgi:hypothetical protein